jgi:hypothetical protein
LITQAWKVRIKTARMYETAVRVATTPYSAGVSILDMVI